MSRTHIISDYDCARCGIPLRWIDVGLDKPCPNCGHVGVVKALECEDWYKDRGDGE